VSNLRRVAESIFEAASNPAAEYQNAALVVDRAGGVRVLDCAAWSLTAIISEFGASEVYLIARKSGQLKVEAWSTAEVCVVTKPAERARMRCGHP
jgi:hypothetical protein